MLFGFSESRGFEDTKCHILSGQPVNFFFVNQIKGDLDRLGQSWTDSSATLGKFLAQFGLVSQLRTS